MRRLKSVRPSEMLFPLGFCTPFVAVCILTPFGEYNTISKREEYKSTKVRKCDSSIVLGARWPNGITTARAAAAAAAPVRPTGTGQGAPLRACVRICVCVFTIAFGVLSSRTTRSEVQTPKLL